MKIHANARTCPNSRRLLVKRIEEENWSLMVAAEAAGISERSAWECCHVCVDDATRLAYVEVLADERGETSSGFLRRAVAWFAERGVKVERVMTDNGSPYVSTIHATTCQELGIRHLRTRPYRPQTNGKAERFIQTMLREWAYGRLYGSSSERCRQLPGWLDRYNYHRKHGSLGHRPPAARLNELLGNNLVRNYS